MCVSLEVSLAAAAVSLGCSSYLFVRNRPSDRYVALVFGYVGTMQILEALMHLDPNCGRLNRTATSIARWQNALQPLVSLAVAFGMYRTRVNSWILGAFAAYAYLSLPGILRAPATCSETCAGGRGLAWEYTKPESVLTWPLFVLALGLPLLSLPHRGKTFLAITIGTYLLAIAISKMRCRPEWGAASGSMWCLMGAFVPLAAIFINARRRRA